MQAYEVVQCQMCGSFAPYQCRPANNICPVCRHIGSLFMSHKTYDQLSDAQKEIIKSHQVG